MTVSMHHRAADGTVRLSRIIQRVIGAIHAETIRRCRNPQPDLSTMGATTLLDFERSWPRHTGAKENAIIERLGLKPARYYALLHRAAESLEGQAHDALTAHRVMRRAVTT